MCLVGQNMLASRVPACGVYGEDWTLFVYYYYYYNYNGQYKMWFILCGNIIYILTYNKILISHIISPGSNIILLVTFSP